ncbi:MAG: hypothetical protein ACLR4Z_00925 [Butyricicoccaceae bacterium]
MSCCPTENCGDDQQLAHDIVCRALQRASRPRRCVHLGKRRSIGACEALTEMGAAGRVRLICHDLIPANIENVRRGVIDFLIDQDAAYAGQPSDRAAASTTCSAGDNPESERILARIDIRNRYNV